MMFPTKKLSAINAFATALFACLAVLKIAHWLIMTRGAMVVLTRYITAGRAARLWLGANDIKPPPRIPGQ
jgi:hypothetical protein